MGDELYKKYRPQTFDEVVGQPQAVEILKGFLHRGSVPHAILFTGNSGNGKTTLARILRKEMGCVSPYDYCEINAAESRGIDTIREIADQAQTRPMSGSARVFLLDEAHQLTRRKGGDAQSALLKTLEDPPSHSYFFLATTHPSDLLKTIRTRCTEIKVRDLSEKELETLLHTTCKKEKVKVSEDVIDRIVKCADSSARKALVILDAVIYLPTEDDQLEAVSRSDSSTQMIELARLLINPETRWAEAAKLLKHLEEDPEDVRRMLLGYFAAVLLNRDSSRAHMIIQALRDSYYECGKAGLVADCYEILRQKK